MAKKGIYKITLLNWERHNSKHKSSYKKTMIDNNFTSDSKVIVMPMSVRWLLLDIILSCGDMATDTIEYTDRSIRVVLESGISTASALNLLKSLQLIRYEKIDFLLNRIEENRIEEKRKEVKATTCEKPISTQVSKAAIRGCIPEFCFDETCNTFLINVTHRAQKSWLNAYPSIDWIVHEIRKANAWCETNSHKAPKDKGKFMLNWLNRGFEEYRKTVATKQKIYDPNSALREKLERDAANEANVI